jgi:hypothetical protein
VNENEAVVLGMWDDYEREGLPGILRWASKDAVWRPHSSSQSVFRSTVAVRGRLRVRQGGVLEDSRMYWVHRVADGKVRWTASSPDLAGLLADGGLPGRANEAYVAMHGVE